MLLRRFCDFDIISLSFPILPFSSSIIAHLSSQRQHLPQYRFFAGLFLRRQRIFRKKSVWQCKEKGLHYPVAVTKLVSETFACSATTGKQ